jgi:hypothetical protein
LLDDYVHQSMIDDVNIISDPNIVKNPPFMVVEEHPPSSFLVVEECPPYPKAKKRKSLVLISTLPKRRTRSTRSAEAAVRWKNME